MRYLALFSLLLAFNAWTAERPQNGTYRCVDGNSSGVCEQSIQFTGNKLEVIYEGECDGQGPFYYACDEEGCSNGATEFTFQGATRYRWDLHLLAISCEMEKI